MLNSGGEIIHEYNSVGYGFNISTARVASISSTGLAVTGNSTATGYLGAFSGGDAFCYLGTTGGGGDFGYLKWKDSNDTINIGTNTGGDTITITEAGNVGIGTATPGAKLDIVQTGAEAALRVYNSQAVDPYGLLVDNTAATSADANYIADFRLAGTSVLSVRNSGNVGIGTADQFGGGVKVVGLANATTAPASNPTGGGVLYVESGALKYRGSSGTVTTIANA
jgi:hypothetical protein